jgi:hypothetical protein
MTFKIQRLPNEPIIVIELSDSFNVQEETVKTFSAIDSLIGADQSVFLIYLSAIQKISFGDVVFSLAEQTRKTPGSISDPRVKKVIVVGDHPLLKMSSGFIKQAQYGGMEVALFTSSDEALAFARKELAHPHSESS